MLNESKRNENSETEVELLNRPMSTVLTHIIRKERHTKL